jgi:hypothetical protein
LEEGKKERNEFAVAVVVAVVVVVVVFSLHLYQCAYVSFVIHGGQEDNNVEEKERDCTAKRFGGEGKLDSAYAAMGKKKEWISEGDDGDDDGGGGDDNEDDDFVDDVERAIGTRVNNKQRTKEKNIVL